MQIFRHKSVPILIAALLIFSMATSMILVSPAHAQTGKQNIITYSYVAVSPNPVGVGQTVNVNFWVDEPPPTASASYGDRWQNMKVIVTSPSGTTTTLGPFTSDDTGGTHTTYVPPTTGNYTFQFIFPGQILAGNNPPPTGFNAIFPGEIPPSAFIGDYYLPSNATTSLVVQSAPITGYPLTPLPSSYWTRPIYALNNNWYSIAGAWLGTGQVNFGTTGTYNNTGNYNPYTTAPTTAHILWTRPVAFGGIAGGGEFAAGGTETGNFYSTSQYEPKWQPIIMYGILYYEEYPSSSTNPAGWAAVDLRTGQTVWTDDATNYGGGTPAQTALEATGQITSLMCGQYLDYVSPNQYGFFAYLWSEGTPAGVKSAGTTFNLFDAKTGNYLLSVVNASASSSSNVFPGFTLVDDSQGNLLIYYVNSTAGTQIIDGSPVTTPTGGSLLECWNSTQNILYPTGYIPGVTGANWMWRPTFSGVYNFAAGIMWGAPVPTTYQGNPITVPLGIPTGSGGGGISSGVVLMNSVVWAGGAFYNPGWEIDAGFSSTNGKLLWIANDTRVPHTLLGTGADYYLGDGYYTYYEAGAEKVSCYSLATGSLVWAHVIPNARAYDSLGGRGIIANGTLYLTTYGGQVYAYDLASGNLRWEYDTPSGGLESPYAYYSIWVFMEDTVADGMLFVPEGHMYSPPLYKGCQQLALNITNGKVVWSITAFDTNNAPAISDGIMTDLNAYDNQIYGYGMGPTRTTVTAPDVGATTSTPVTITGTVMDISAGASQQAVAANFPNGLPCVSDASMTQFMEAVYMQQPMPTNVTGVSVTVSVLDSNGNNRVIGTTTTNANGFYSLMWTPDIPGNFTVTATFAGTQSYYGSSATTAFNAASISSKATPTASPVSGLATESTVMYLGVALIVVVIIIGAILAMLSLRKR